MVSFSHESLLELFRSGSRAATEVLRLLAVQLPEYDKVQAGSAQLSDLTPAEYRADLVLFLEQDSRYVLGIIVEVQLGRDEDKTYAWPAYIANLRSRHRCPVCLLVVTTEDSVAHWAGRTIDLGPGTRCIPWVIGPSNTPAVTELRQAQDNVELAVLSAIVHMHDSNTELAARIVSVARDAAAHIDAERSKLCLDFINIHLGSAAQELKNTMNSFGYEYKSEFARRYMAEGKAEGRAEGRVEGRVEIVLKLLAKRFGPLPDSIQTRVRGAQDAQLDTVVEQVLTAQTLEEALGSLD